MQLRKLSIAVAAALITQGSVAQTLLEEIIVTAQKRTESVQDVPSTVNVIGASSIEDFKVLNFQDLGALTAGLEIDSLTGRSGRMTMRGIAHNPNSAAEAAVTTYWNQAIVDGNSVYQMLYDMERVEVLRGPQGTLAGRTSPAGAINMHTAKPNMDETEGRIRAVVTDNNGINTEVAFSVPLIPGKLAVRFAGVYDESDLDEIENDLSGFTTDEETTAGRLSVSWLPSDNFSVDLAVQYLERERNNLDVLEGTPDDPFLDPDGVLRELDTFDRASAVLGFLGEIDNTDADFLNTSLVLNWELGNHTITSVTGYHDTDSVRTFDQARGNANPDNVIGRIATDDRKDWSQEIRIANHSNESWEYMFGAYYENTDVEFTQDNYIPPGHPVAPGSQLLVFPAELDRTGLFTHHKFYLADDWTLQIGARWQEMEGERDLSMVGGPGGIPFMGLEPGDLVLQVLSEANKKYDDDAITGELTLQYQFDEDVMVYGHVGTGWRPGGITVTGSALPEEVLLFGAEDSISYELGFKSTLMGGAMRLNGAVFYQQFDDYIARTAALSILDLQGAVKQGGLTVNGDAEVWGVELEMEASLSDNWSLGGSLSYTDGEWDDGTQKPCNEYDDSGAPVIPDGYPVALCDVGGDPIGSAPDWTASINSEYSIPFDSFDGYGRVLYTYTGERHNEGLGDLDAYQLVDLYLGIRTNQWDVSLFAKNLLDEEEIRTGTFATQTVRKHVTGYGQRWPLPQRRVGISASYRF
ncbi:MAG: TonB-dependent receptor [Halieaceae bacterium]|jgi:iron complex outermembrane recepter protein|nr:TonB-dependent receptor [Halieaceae bacterium]